MMPILTSLFHIDALAIVMLSLILLVGAGVARFAYHYLQGDSRYRVFFGQLLLLILSMILMVCANHLIVLLSAWCFSNALLVRLMIHKAAWRAAKASGRLAAQNYGLGAIFLASACVLFYAITGETSIQALLQHNHPSPALVWPLLLLIIAAMSQSALWPFHRWLLSSLNSPTPVSALMHAGLVNGGGFLLARFAPLYSHHQGLLTTLFVIGISSALLGTMWKLMQSDVKRMLACSTMGQMGFMMAQCGLGLFAAAITHLCLHGMFKAYLFLNSASAVQQKRLDLGYPPSVPSFIAALLCGVVGSYVFAWVSGKSWLAGDSTLVLLVVALVSCSQFALPLLRHKPLRHLPLALMATGVFSWIYGGSIYVVSLAIQPIHAMQPQPLNGFYIIGMALLSLPWLAMLLGCHGQTRQLCQAWVDRGYVMALNASQPHANTITAHRHHYHQG